MINVDKCRVVKLEKDKITLEGEFIARYIISDTNRNPSPRRFKFTLILGSKNRIEELRTTVLDINSSGGYE